MTDKSEATNERSEYKFVTKEDIEKAQYRGMCCFKELAERLLRERDVWEHLAKINHDCEKIWLEGFDVEKEAQRLLGEK